MVNQASKPEADKKVEGSFNKIVISILALVAVILLVAVIFFRAKGSSVVPAAPAQSSPTHPQN